MSDNLVNRLDRFYQVIKENGIDIPVIIVSRTPFAQDKFDELISNKNKTVKMLVFLIIVLIIGVIKYYYN
jgi:hypothetical protein